MAQSEFSKHCRKVATTDAAGQPNGWLVELYSEHDGFTEGLRGQVYATIIAPHTAKGFHVHAKAFGHFTCLVGFVRSVVVNRDGDRRQMQLDPENLRTVKVWPGEAHCLFNESDVPATIINFRTPAWSPNDPEQLTIAPEVIDDPAARARIEQFLTTNG